MSSSTVVTQSSGSSIKLDASSAIEDDNMAKSDKPDDDAQPNLLQQVYDWLEHEKSRRKVSKARRAEATASQASEDEDRPVEGTSSSGSSFSLDKLEKILLQYGGPQNQKAHSPLFQPTKRLNRRRPKGLRRGSASESDYTDVEAPVPGVESFLDNSKTLAYPSSSAADDDIAAADSNPKRAKDREAWLIFKTDILRLTHTLQLRGWRKLSMDAAQDMEVIRLSGALTNAVYVVKPPKTTPASKTENGHAPLKSTKPPPKLLLRVYGPQVDHLIDREKELQILRRLGRRNIGPRVLGTFKNGRFEEFFEARTLTPKDLRIPETAKQIAKRMRELHDGMELLEEEREGGPVVFSNWDKWVDRCSQVGAWLDKEVTIPVSDAKAAADPWRRRGYEWIIANYGGMDEIKRQLVFAHNDTQYGNLLRLEPASESPLLLPANEHKQLVVIDFEYSSANTAGLEFANHFTEWCYNYHDEEKSWACNTRLYPTPEEQRRFIKTYVNHRPALGGGVNSPLATPSLRAGGGSSVTPFTLDDCSSTWQQAEKAAEEEVDAEVRNLLGQTRMWRAMNSALWIAWGIVQFKYPGMEEEIAAANGDSVQNQQNGDGGHKVPPVDVDVDEEDGFDYLAYAQDRAMFFWSDILALGLIDPEELPKPMVEHLRTRMIEY
ncbi:hypothetical protein N7470_003913 [Penicillium chermesinum]|nr:hypothetical protein N7470_003913 [Penicillium chermesinum]